MVEKIPRAGSLIIGFEIAPEIDRYVVTKGSVAVDGVSLTVNRCEKNRFYVNIIPHTAAGTTFGFKKAGDEVNIETDILARYLEKLIWAPKDGGASGTAGGSAGGIDPEMLARYGFIK